MSICINLFRSLSYIWFLKLLKIHALQNRDKPIDSSNFIFLHGFHIKMDDYLTFFMIFFRYYKKYNDITIYLAKEFNRVEIIIHF